MQIIDINLKVKKRQVGSEDSNVKIIRQGGYEEKSFDSRINGQTGSVVVERQLLCFFVIYGHKKEDHKIYGSAASWI